MGWIYAGAILVLIFGVVVFRGAPYVPSHRKYARRALDDLYRVTSKDVLIDIGSGDGVILRLAAAHGARAIGYEINPILVMITKLLSLNNPRVRVRLADFWLVTLPRETTVVYAFAVSRDIEKIGAKMQKTANEIGRELWFITYDAPLASKKPVKTLDAHALYRFIPQ